MKRLAPPMRSCHDYPQKICPANSRLRRGTAASRYLSLVCGGCVAAIIRAKMGIAVSSGGLVVRESNSRHLDDVIFIYISLERSTDRRADIEHQLQSNGFRHEWFRAVDGNQALEQWPDQKKRRFLRSHGRHVRPGEAGCYMSHLGALRQFLASPYDMAVILEDDAVLVDPDRLRRVLSPSNRSSYDLLRLQSRRRYRSLPMEVLDDGTALSINWTRSTGSTGYAVNRKAAAALLATLSDMEVPFDHAFDRPQRHRLKYRHIRPALIDYRDGPSTIETTRPAKAGALIKASTLVWRAKSEIGRFVHALSAFSWFKMMGRSRGLASAPAMPSR